MQFAFPLSLLFSIKIYLFIAGVCAPVLSCCYCYFVLNSSFALPSPRLLRFLGSSAFDLANGGDDDDDNGGSGEKGSKKNARAPSQKRSSSSSSGEVDGEEAVAIASALVAELSQACAPLLAAKTPPAAQAALDRAGAGVRYPACVSGGGGLLASASVWDRK